MRDAKNELDGSWSDRLKFIRQGLMFGIGGTALIALVLSMMGLVSQFRLVLFVATLLLFLGVSILFGVERYINRRKSSLPGEILGLGSTRTETSRLVSKKEEQKYLQARTELCRVITNLLKGRINLEEIERLSQDECNRKELLATCHSCLLSFPEREDEFRRGEKVIKRKK